MNSRRPLPAGGALADASGIQRLRAGIGVADALTAGLSRTARRPWLAAIPFIVDLLIWLAPPFSVRDLLNRMVAAWEALLPLAYPPSEIAALREGVEGVREAADLIGAEVNLWHLLSGSWLSAPSALVAPQGTRLTFISDLIFAPVGLSLQLPQVAGAPWQPDPVQVPSVWLAALLGAVLWLVGMLFVTALMRLAGEASSGLAHGEGPHSPDGAATSQPLDETIRPPEAFGRLFVRLSAFSLALGFVLFVLRLPVSLVLTFIMLTGSAGGALLFAVIGGITLWIMLWLLTSLYFASEAILFDRQPVFRSVGQSIALVRMQSLATIGLALVINLVLLGFRAVWRLVGQNPAGAVLAMAGNAYLGTSMLIGVFAYYQDRRRTWDDLVAQAKRRADLNDRMKD